MRYLFNVRFLFVFCVALIPLATILYFRGESGTHILPQLKEMWGGPPAEKDITMVMAYYNLGSVVKTLGEHTRTKADYLEWAEFYQWLENPMVIYSDDAEFLQRMRVLRQNFTDRTLFLDIGEEEPLWSLGLEPAIADIFADPNYPKYSPETVVPKYSCAMHSKYELVARVVQQNPFNTPYFGWCDVGEFREVKTKGKYYRVSLPPLFDDSRVAMSKVFDMDTKLTPRDVIDTAKVWIAGGFFLGNGGLLTRLYRQYRVFTDRFVADRTMGSDEQVFYMMYLPQNRPNTSVPLQLYWSQGACNLWFYLGFISIRDICTQLKAIEFIDPGT